MLIVAFFTLMGPFWFVLFPWLLLFGASQPSSRSRRISVAPMLHSGKLCCPARHRSLSANNTLPSHSRVLLVAVSQLSQQTNRNAKLNARQGRNTCGTNTTCTNTHAKHMMEERETAGFGWLTAVVSPLPWLHAVFSLPYPGRGAVND